MIFLRCLVVRRTVLQHAKKLGAKGVSEKDTNSDLMYRPDRYVIEMPPRYQTFMPPSTTMSTPVT